MYEVYRKITYLGGDKRGENSPEIVEELISNETTLDKKGGEIIMASKTLELKTYVVYLGSKMLLTIGGTSVHVQALILCRDGGGRQSFDIIVTPDSDSIPNTSEITNQRTYGRICVPSNQYTLYLDLLRNERPIFAVVDDSNPLLNRIWCGEPVGEAEYWSSRF